MNIQDRKRIGAQINIPSTVMRKTTAPSIWKKAAGILSPNKTKLMIKHISSTRIQWEKLLNTHESVS